MKQEHLGDGAYVTVNRDYRGQVIVTANHHEPRQAADVVSMEISMVRRILKVYEADLKEGV